MKEKVSLKMMLKSYFMQFYSGFSLKDEEYLFENYINKGEYTVCGFSYGAIKAFEFTLEQLSNSIRIDTLQLFSPAFFQTKEKKFRRLQLMSYKKNRDAYLQQFIAGCFTPFEKKIISHRDTTLQELEELLEYNWDKEALLSLVKQGVKIEVYLGSQDMIIDVENARELFLDVATVTYIKEANHFLQTC